MTSIWGQAFAHCLSLAAVGIGGSGGGDWGEGFLRLRGAGCSEPPAQQPQRTVATSNRPSIPGSSSTLNGKRHLDQQLPRFEWYSRNSHQPVRLCCALHSRTRIFAVDRSHRLPPSSLATHETADILHGLNASSVHTGVGRIEGASPHFMHKSPDTLQPDACYSCCACNFHLHLHPITKSTGERHGPNGLREFQACTDSYKYASIQSGNLSSGFTTNSGVLDRFDNDW